MFLAELVEQVKLLRLPMACARGTGCALSHVKTVSEREGGPMTCDWETASPDTRGMPAFLESTRQLNLQRGGGAGG